MVGTALGGSPVPCAGDRGHQRGQLQSLTCAHHTSARRGGEQGAVNASMLQRRKVGLREGRCWPKVTQHVLEPGFHGRCDPGQSALT